MTFIKYSVVGVSGTVIDVGLFALLIATTPLESSTTGHVTAASLSFLAAVINNYVWNRRWTFRDRTSRVRTQFTKFFIVSCGGWLLNTLSLLLFSLAISPVVAKLGASGVVLAYNYSANRSWTFRQTAQLE